MPLATTDILQVESRLYDYSPAAAAKFTDEVRRLTETLAVHPLMFQISENDDYFRCMPLLND